MNADETLPLHIPITEARARLRTAPAPFTVLFEYADCSVELYAPKGTDKQQPHAQDELYIISAGKGTFRREDTAVSVAAGDMLFVPAHIPHRFENFSDDFETWVIFFGPRGGSKPRP